MDHDLTPIGAYYDALSDLDDDARKVAWRACHDQEVRFENLLEVLDDRRVDRGLSLLDVGCGLGDLYGYLQRTGRGAVQYTGVDLLPDMIAGARARWPEARFLNRDLIHTPLHGESFDVVVCSGALSVTVPDHAFVVQTLIARMVHLAREAVAFNMLSARHQQAAPHACDPHLHYADPLATYAYARSLVRWAALREDTLPSDFTVYLYPGYARSIDRYRHAPAPPPDPFGLAWLYLERRLPNDALALLDAHPDADTDAALVNLRGVAHHQLRDLRAARRLYRRALALDPDCAPARLNLDALARRG